MNKNQVLNRSNIQPVDLELLQEECEEDMVNYVRAKRLGLAQRAAKRARREDVHHQQFLQQ